MMTGQSKRDAILRTAWRLFESQGYHATGINQIIAESGVPKGSFYHYFPDGKEGLALEAIQAISEGLTGKVREICAGESDSCDAVVRLFHEIARILEQTGFREGGPLTTVALETATTNERINRACQQAYNALHDELVNQLDERGFPGHKTHEISTMIVAGLEGGILLSRTLQSPEPLKQIARQIETNLLAAQRPASSRGRKSGTDCE